MKKLENKYKIPKRAFNTWDRKLIKIFFEESRSGIKCSFKFLKKFLNLGIVFFYRDKKTKKELS